MTDKELAKEIIMNALGVLCIGISYLMWRVKNWK